MGPEEELQYKQESAKLYAEEEARYEAAAQKRAEEESADEAAQQEEADAEEATREQEPAYQSALLQSRRTEEIEGENAEEEEGAEDAVADTSMPQKEKSLSLFSGGLFSGAIFVFFDLPQYAADLLIAFMGIGLLLKLLMAGWILIGWVIIYMWLKSKGRSLFDTKGGDWKLFFGMLGADLIPFIPGLSGFIITYILRERFRKKTA